MPRDAGGTITINDGTGPIRTMLSTGDLLFVYKADKTFKVETPETIDPKRTNPSAPFVVSAVENIGCSHWIVARVLLQGYEMLNSCSVSQVEKTAICKQLYKCRESLVRCESVAVRVAARVDAIEKLVQRAGENVLRGRVLTNSHKLRIWNSIAPPFFLKPIEQLRLFLDCHAFSCDGKRQTTISTTYSTDSSIRLARMRRSRGSLNQSH
jgi:hypothetical protein